MDKKNMVKNTVIRSRIVIAILFVFFLLSVIFLIDLLRDIGWALLLKVGPMYLAAILLLLVLGTALYVVAIYVLVHASGYKTTFLQAYLILTSSLSMNYVTPLKVGIPLRIFLYSHCMNIPSGVGTALVVVETFLGMFTSALAASFGIAFLFTGNSIYVPLTLIAFMIACIVTIVFVPLRPLASLLRRLSWLRFVQRLIRFLEQVRIGLRSIPAWVSLVLLALFVLAIAIHAVRLYLVLHAFGHRVSPIALFFVLTVSITAGNLSMIPMGLGVRDASFILLLAKLGVPNEIALSAAVIQRLFSPGWPLLLGLISTNILGVSELVRRSDNISATQESSEPKNWIRP